ncbi:hypothetical protein RB601_004920 [Gaeumannomyces tritici]
MAVFVDLEDGPDQPQDFQHGKPVWKPEPEDRPPRPPSPMPESESGAGQAVMAGNPNLNSVTEALGCYPIIVVIAASLDLNSIDSLARTCRQARSALIQYRSSLIKSSLRCFNEPLPVDPEQTLRYRARAGNWYYMEDTSRTSYSGKPGDCARDLVGECHKCGQVVCRNCAIKPPAPIVLRDRHRRLCNTCTKAPITELVKPPLDPTTPLASPAMQSKICRCESGVWLCQTCGRSIRGADHEYKGLWRWRGQYGEVLGGVGTGIGDGDRGVPCGREDECLGAKECEHETDCEAADAAAADTYFAQQQQQSQAAAAAATNPLLLLQSPVATWPNSNHHHNNNNNNNGGSGMATPDSSSLSSRRHTPSPGYARHEIEGIGGVVKTKLVRMVRVGAGVPEWQDEKPASRGGGEALAREVAGRVRSWCGWCARVIPGRDDLARDAARLLEEEEEEEEGQGQGQGRPGKAGGEGKGGEGKGGSAALGSSSVSTAPSFSSTVALRGR